MLHICSLSTSNLMQDKDDSTFVDILNSNVNQPVKLEVFNALQNQSRGMFASCIRLSFLFVFLVTDIVPHLSDIEAVLLPNRDWGGPGLAGINVRMSDVTKALSLVWHVVLVHSNGPASSAGLESGTDFIVGVPGLLFSEPDDFYNLVKVNVNKALSLYVYSTKTRMIRVVSVTPDHNWGGNGFLGCDVAYGLNHQLVTTLASSSDTKTSPPSATQVAPKITPLTAPNKTAITPAPPIPFVPPSSAAVRYQSQDQTMTQGGLLSSHQKEHTVKKGVKTSKSPAQHKHSPQCDHSHDHHDHEHHDHDRDHDHDHDHGNNQAHQHGESCKHNHSHSHPSVQGPSTPKPPSKKPTTSGNTSTSENMPSTPKDESAGGGQTFTYTPSQLFSPFQKLPDNYYATPLPEDFLEGEEAIPFQARFGH